MTTESVLPYSHEPGIKTYPELKQSNARIRTPKPAIDDVVYAIIQ
jgi:hypothetical protein